MMYRAFDWLTTAAVRHPGRASSALRWAVLLVLGVLFVSAVAAGSDIWSLVLGLLAIVALLVVMRGVYSAAVARHLDDASE